MKLARYVLTAMAVVACAAAPAHAQKVEIPDAATVQCNDGSWSTAATQRGACSRHKGVKHWIGRRPANAAARCNDGEYWTNATLQGACSSHGGVFKSYKAEEKAEKRAAKAEEKVEKAEHKADKKVERAEDKAVKAERKADRKEKKTEMKMSKP